MVYFNFKLYSKRNNNGSSNILSISKYGKKAVLCKHSYNVIFDIFISFYKNSLPENSIKFYFGQIM